MKIVKIHLSAAGRVSLAATHASIGQSFSPAGMTLAIADVPPDVSEEFVLRQFDRTVIVNPAGRGFAFHFHELGAGRIIAA